MKVRFHDFGSKVCDEMFSKFCGFAVTHTRLHGISNLNTQNPEKAYLEKSRLRFANDHFLAFVHGYDSRSSLSSGNSDSGISFAMI